ncbi:MAG TPA: dimethylargininase, partial [Rhodanobacteraceae bacterium]
SVFVEDTAIVLDEVAVLTRPGAASRRGEVDSMAQALAPYRPLRHMQAPATLDGGDVLRLDHVLYVGQSGRSNAAGIAALHAFVAPFGYRVQAVPLHGCLHLKSAVTQIAPDRILMNPDWVEATHFAGYQALMIDPAEAHAANAVWLDDRVLLSAAFPRTAERVRAAGIDVRTLDMSETEKAEGALTCCSVLLAA